MNGGLFQMISNRGKQDSLLLATDKLLVRLKDIATERERYMRELYPQATVEQIRTRVAGWAPVLAEIEKSHVLLVNASFKPFVAMTHEYMKVNPSGSSTRLGNTLNFKLPIIGDFISDAVIYIRLEGLAAVDARDRVRYTELPGHRLFEHLQFKVQEFVLDEYFSDDMNAYLNFQVTPTKETGYLRNIGQELPQQGYLITDPTTSEIREYKWYGNGAQTYKRAHVSLEMWMPLLFWPRDVQSAVPNVLLPQSQTVVSVKLADQNELISFADFGGGGAHTTPRIAECSMYLNQIFLLPEVMHVYITRFGFQLVRVHRRHRESLIEASGEVHLNQIKWPVETLYIGFRPQINLLNSAYWHRNGHIVDTAVPTPVVVGEVSMQVNSAIFSTEYPVVARMGLIAHGIQLYNEIVPGFYNSYLPFQYGANLRTPKDSGWYMINFCQLPGEYQPSGHLNTSRVRELYLQYTSAVDPVSGQALIRSDNPVDLIVLARCINFIVYDGGNATIRYIT